MLRAKAIILVVTCCSFPSLCRGFLAPVRQPVLPTRAKHLAKYRFLFNQHHDTLLMLSNKAEEEGEQRSRVGQGQNKTLDAFPNLRQSLFATIIQNYDRLWQGHRPPMEVEDMNLLFYDVFLIINLAVSISFWVVHRMDFTYIGTAFNEGCLMSLMWIGAGLYSGAFLHTAVDGHNGSDHLQGGPKAAGILAFQAYINACSLRLLFALAVAVVQHRPVGFVLGEQILPLEIGFGLIMISSWRILHSSFAQRL